MICGIMRVEKRKRSDVYGLQLEANRSFEDYQHGRDFERSDIRWEDTHMNISLIHCDGWNQEITRQIQEASLKEIKVGANRSVVMLDGLFTASSEWFETHTSEEARRFFDDCLSFHVEHYCGGNRDRVINAQIHLDETTPHLHVASVPIIDIGEKIKLSAKEIMGNRRDYRIRQDCFYEEVSRKYDMERGEVLDEAEIRIHTTKREWQLATQEERIESARMEADQLEMKVETMREKLHQIESKIETSPHILTKEELDKINLESCPVNRITGNVSIPLITYQELLATRIEADNLRVERKKYKVETEKIKAERRNISFEKEKALSKAREEGLKLGLEDQKAVIEKSRSFDQVLELLKEDNELGNSFKKALEPNLKRYPELVQSLSAAFDWAREMVQKLKMRISQTFHFS